MVGQTALVRHASDIDLTYNRGSTQIQVLGSWTNRIRLQPDCTHEKPEVRTFRFKKAVSTRESSLDTSPESTKWNQQFRQKWRKEQVRGRRVGILPSPDSSAASLDALDAEQGEDTIFGMDDVDAALPSTGSNTSPVNCAASDEAARSMSPLRMQKPVAHLAAWRGHLSRPGAAPTSQPIAINFKATALQTALQRHMPAQQQQQKQQDAKVQVHIQQTQHVQQCNQLTLQRLQNVPLEAQGQQQPLQPQPQRSSPQASNVPQASTARPAQAAVFSSGICPTSSQPLVSNPPPQQLQAKTAKAPSDIRSNMSTRSSDSEGSIMTAVYAAMAPEEAAMMQAAGLPPIRRVIMRGSSGKFKSHARMYQPELPPKYYCASQAA